MQGGEENAEKLQTFLPIFSALQSGSKVLCAMGIIILYKYNTTKRSLLDICLDLKHLLQVKLQSMIALELPVSRGESRPPRSHPGPGRQILGMNKQETKQFRYPFPESKAQ